MIRSETERAWLYAESEDGKALLTPHTQDARAAHTEVAHSRLCNIPRDIIHLTDYHIHPQAGAKVDAVSVLTPSADDFQFWIKGAAFLLSQGYTGTYEGRVITPIGMFIITPNMELLRNDPDAFRRHLQPVLAYDRVRLKFFPYLRSIQNRRISDIPMKSYLAFVNSRALSVAYVPFDQLK